MKYITLIITTFLLTIGYSQAEYLYGNCKGNISAGNFSKILKYCKEEADNDMTSRLAYGTALATEGRYSEAMPYLLTSKAKADQISIIDYYIGIIYYFGLATPSYPKSESLGLKYLQASKFLNDSSSEDSYSNSDSEPTPNLAKEMLKFIPELQNGTLAMLPYDYMIMQYTDPAHKCIEAGSNKEFKQAIELCKPVADKNLYAKRIYALSLLLNHNYSDAVIYLQEMIELYKNPKYEDKKALAIFSYGLGTIYYFGSAAPKYPQNKSKGLLYINQAVKDGAGIGQDFAKRFIEANKKIENGKINSIPEELKI
ncbi:hypothetical protein ACFPDQ_03295 [Pseudofrancisella aestuarii]|uniref:Sel1 repeat family protein n=1 Tax=Pseudofrancisella aestuarii TaxID=2670347 RepID=A0ABV9TAB3_9GAMM|nr:hypothetical protein [Pseudofrancisella aestuarii]